MGKKTGPKPGQPHSGQFPPGKSPNPNGAPIKENRLSTWIDKELDRQMTPDMKGYIKGVTVRQAIARGLIKGALAGVDERIRLDYIKEIADRTEGKATQKLAGDPDGVPLTVSVVNFADQNAPAEDK